MSFSTGQQPFMSPTGMQGFSTPNKWASKMPRGLKSGFQQQFTPEQMNLFQQLFGQVGPESFLSKIAGGDLGAFEEMEAPAWRDFNQAQGQLASRFTGMGGGQGQRALSSQKSSGFRNAMGQLGSDFAQDLQAKRQLYRQNAIKELMGLGTNLLNQRPFDQFIAPKGPSNIEKFLNYAVPVAQSTMGAGARLMGGM